MIKYMDIFTCNISSYVISLFLEHTFLILYLPTQKLLANKIASSLSFCLDSRLHYLSCFSPLDPKSAKKEGGEMSFFFEG